MSGALASLRGNRRFQLLWFSNLFFFGGVWTQTLVLGWMAYELTQSELLVAVFTAVRLAPMILGPVAGALADRYDRVRLLIVATAWAVAAVAVVAALATAGLVNYGVLVVGGLAVGLAQSPSQPARASLVVELVDLRDLSNANALNAIAMNMTQVVGPALGGSMIAVIGAPAALWFSSLWYVVALLLVLPMRAVRGRARRPRGSVVSMVTGGLREIGAIRLTVAVLMITLAANTLIWPIFQSFMPVFAEESLDIDAAGLGVLLACSGVGGLVGSLVIACLGDFRHKGGVFVVGTAMWGVLWAAFALVEAPTPAFLLMTLIGVFSATFGVLQTTLMLLTTDTELHGRALGLQELAIGVMPFAAVLLGVVAERFGVGATTLGCGVLLAVVMVSVAIHVPELLTFSGSAPPDLIEDTGLAAERATADGVDRLDIQGAKD